MRLHPTVLIPIFCFIGAALLAWAQSPKAGLYDVATKMPWQQSPFPAGMKDPRESGSPHSTQVCFTREEINKYNGPKPTASAGCQISNIQKHPGSMTAELTCGAPMTGKGKVETRWIDSRHSESRIHFTGSMHVGSETKSIEWTLESKSTFRGADCGSVKPLAD